MPDDKKDPLLKPPAAAPTAAATATTTTTHPAATMPVASPHVVAAQQPAPDVSALVSALRAVASGPSVNLEPPASHEIREGGQFRVNDRLVDAEGKPIKDKDEPAKPEGGA